VDVHSPFSGTVVEMFAKEGDEVDVGAPLFVLVEGPGTGSAPAAKAAPAPAAKAAQAAAAPAPPKATAPAPAATAPASAPATTAGNDRSETRVKMTRMRQRISQRCAR
jgi:pyruvate/2-oxoglutarate dehydrogenase complex dihydrolipoamide acyltransferase (E2) component